MWWGSAFSATVLSFPVVLLYSLWLLAFLSVARESNPSSQKCQEGPWHTVGPGKEHVLNGTAAVFCSFLLGNLRILRVCIVPSLYKFYFLSWSKAVPRELPSEVTTPAWRL